MTIPFFFGLPLLASGYGPTSVAELLGGAVLMVMAGGAAMICFAAGCRALWLLFNFAIGKRSR